MCNTAFEAGNYQETIEYCNKILEINPSNVDAWKNKAFSTFWLSTVAYNRFDEAMEYLNKASQLAPNDPIFDMAREEITVLQAAWMIQLAADAGNNALETMKVWSDDGLVVARQQGFDDIKEAMDYLLLASEYLPNDVAAIERIAKFAKLNDWIKWGDKVNQKIIIYEKIKKKEVAEQKLPEFKEKFRNAQMKLKELKSKKSFLVNRKIKETEIEIRQLQDEISQLVKLASYDFLEKEND